MDDNRFEEYCHSIIIIVSQSKDRERDDNVLKKKESELNCRGVNEKEHSF